MEREKLQRLYILMPKLTILQGKVKFLQLLKLLTALSLLDHILHSHVLNRTQNKVFSSYIQRGQSCLENDCGFLFVI